MIIIVLEGHENLNRVFRVIWATRIVFNSSSV